MNRYYRRVISVMEKIKDFSKKKKTLPLVVIRISHLIRLK